MEPDKYIKLGCECDDCVRKIALLKSLEVAGGPPTGKGGSSGQSFVEELREELAQHHRRSNQAPMDDDAVGNRLAIRKPNAKRPWLNYDPDALLPMPFDAFLLGGGCPRVAWPRPNTTPTPGPVGASRSSAKIEVSLCYVVGCGRSGTTVLCELLSRYVGVVFINEPRQLWIPLLPPMDVWSVAAPKRGGRLRFSPREASGFPAGGGGQSVSSLVSDCYADVAELASATPPLAGGPTTRQALVVEKFPEHAFRLPFLADLCKAEFGPNRCTFVHIIRDGLDVARSIAAFENPAAWYGVKDEWKWRCLCEFIAPGMGKGGAAASDEAYTAPDVESFLDVGEDFVRYLQAQRTDEQCRFARGLAEWAVSVLAARHGSEEAKEARYVEVRYEELLDSPAKALAALANILELEPSAAARQRAKEALVARPSKPPTDQEREVLMSARGSRIEELLREFGRGLPT